MSVSLYVFIDDKLYYYVIPTDLHASKFYRQSKIHKPGFPLRGSLLRSLKIFNWDPESVY